MMVMAGEQPAAMGSSPNRRNFERRKTLKSAKIVFNKKQSVLDCFVRDMSDTGARLAVSDLIPVPRNFTLVLNDGTSRECERVRAMGKELGVRFLK
jgi:hypothetical protein